MRALPENANGACGGAVAGSVEMRDRVASINELDKPNAVSHQARFTATPALRFKRAKTGAIAWCRVMDSVAEMRQVLDYRIEIADAGDMLLASDCQTWCELARALADFLDARREA